MQLSLYSYATGNQNLISFGIGPQIGFEYFVSKRISINTTLAAFSYGLSYDKWHTYSTGSGLNYYLNQHGKFAIYKTISLGVHYNFGK
jgi:hypothetical protein